MSNEYTVDTADGIVTIAGTGTGIGNDCTLVYDPDPDPDLLGYSTDVMITSTWEVAVDALAEEVKELKEMLYVVSRDVNMEERYPELKAAYEEYKRVMEKLQVFEKLQEKQDGTE